MALQYPNMREEVIDALQALGDPDYQRRVWLKRDWPDPACYDSLDENVHILFDDVDVCVDPAAGSGLCFIHPRWSRSESSVKRSGP